MTNSGRRLLPSGPAGIGLVRRKRRIPSRTSGANSLLRIVLNSSSWGSVSFFQTRGRRRGGPAGGRGFRRRFLSEGFPLEPLPLVFVLGPGRSDWGGGAGRGCNNLFRK